MDEEQIISIIMLLNTVLWVFIGAYLTGKNSKNK